MSHETKEIVSQERNGSLFDQLSSSTPYAGVKGESMLRISNVTPFNAGRKKRHNELSSAGALISPVRNESNWSSGLNEFFNTTTQEEAVEGFNITEPRTICCVWEREKDPRVLHPKYHHLPQWLLNQPKPTNTKLLSSIDDALWEEFSSLITHDLEKEKLGLALLKMIGFLAFAIFWFLPSTENDGSLWWESIAEDDDLDFLFVFAPILILLVTSCVLHLYGLSGRVKRTILSFQNRFAKKSIKVELVSYTYRIDLKWSISSRYIIFAGLGPLKHRLEGNEVC